MEAGECLGRISRNRFIDKRPIFEIRGGTGKSLMRLVDSPKSGYT